MSADSENNTINQNFIYENEHGIKLNPAYNNTLKGNLLQDNPLENNPFSLVRTKKKLIPSWLMVTD